MCVCVLMSYTVYLLIFYMWGFCEGHLAMNEVSVSSAPNGIITAGGRAHY